jgi:hypothetical protein
VNCKNRNQSAHWRAGKVYTFAAASASQPALPDREGHEQDSSSFKCIQEERLRAFTGIVDLVQVQGSTGTDDVLAGFRVRSSALSWPAKALLQSACERRCVLIQ